MLPRTRLAWLVAGGVPVIACAPRPTARPAVPVPVAAFPCMIASDSSGPARPVTAAFDDAGDAERTARASTLLAPVRLDCEGRPSAGLATAWSRDSSGRYWTLELAEVTRPDSGAAWTAGTLAATWRSDSTAATTLRFAGVQSLLPLDERRLVVGFSAPELELPTVFADRSLGVARPAPLGSPVTPEPPTPDLRDAIDGPADLVHTSDPDVLEYAEHRPGRTTVALPWDRVYLLLLPQGSPGVGAAISADTAAFEASLARDAVRVEARPTGLPSWWARTASCDSPRAPAAGRSSRAPGDAVAYRSDDRVARDLAERLVALAGDPALIARGLSDGAFRGALAAGAERGYIVSLPARADVSCRELASWPAGAMAVPLIETRPHAILRRGTPPLAVEWDGAVAGP